MRSFPSVLLVTVLASTGCYHATISTGAPTSLEVIEQPFASSYIYGLVPPKTVETAAKCPSGVAKVETRQSFLNGLVGALTLGIYTPMTIKVTCAARSAMGSLPREATTVVTAGGDPTAVRQAFEEAARKSRDSGDAVLVELRQP